MENHHFQWENPLFLWSFSIAMLNYQRVFLFANHIFGGDPVGASTVVATLATLAATAVADRWVRPKHGTAAKNRRIY